MTKESPLFKSTDSALKFAYAIAEVDIYASPVYMQTIRQHMAKSSRTEKLSPHDWQVQGSMIRQRVMQQEELVTYYAVALYSWNERDRGIALAAMYGHTKKHTPMLRNREMMRLLVDRYVGIGRRDRKTKADISRQSAVHHKTVAGWEKRIHGILGPLHAKLFEELDSYFAEAGLIPPQ